MGRRVHPGFTKGAVIGDIKIKDVNISAANPGTNIVLDTSGSGVVSIDSPAVFTNATNSTNSGTGAVVVTGSLGVAGNMNVSGLLNGGVIENTRIGVNTPATGNFTNVTVSGLTTLAEISERVTSIISSASGPITFDFNNGTVFYALGPAGNITANFTNIPTVANRIITFNIILQQGVTAGFYVDDYTINGSPTPLEPLWAGSSPPVPTAGSVDVQTFNILYDGSNYTVWSQMTSFS